MSGLASANRPWAKASARFADLDRSHPHAGGQQGQQDDEVAEQHVGVGQARAPEGEDPDHDGRHQVDGWPGLDAQHVDGEGDVEAQVREMCERLLANPLIESYEVQSLG